MESGVLGCPYALVLRSAIPTARLASKIFSTHLHFVFKMNNSSASRVERYT
jgi:hypothetical protein